MTELADAPASSPVGVLGVLHAAYRPICSLCTWAAGACLILLAAIGAVDIVGRYAGFAVPSALEISEALLASSIFLALPAVQSAHANITIDALYLRLGRRMRGILSRAHGLIVAASLLAVAWLFWRAGLESYRSGEIATGHWLFVLWPFKCLSALGVTVAGFGSILAAFDAPADTGVAS